MTERKITKSDCKYYRESDGNCLNFTYVGEYDPCTKLSPVIDKLNELSEENSKLQNQIDELEDDNEKYSKSLDKLEDYTKRFIPTKCLNEFKDCKTNRYYWLDHEGNLEGALELLNLMDCENEQLKQQKDKWKQQCIHFKEMLDDMDIAYLCDEWIYEELKGDV